VQRLEPYEKFAAMIDHHWDGIAAYCRPENKVSLGRGAQPTRNFIGIPPRHAVTGRTGTALMPDGQSRIHLRAARNRPLSERQKSANTTRSKVRARVEHVFGHQQSLDGRQDRADHRHRAGEVQDRVQLKRAAAAST
jgi:hypothetical protein